MAREIEIVQFVSIINKKINILLGSIDYQKKK